MHLMMRDQIVMIANHSSLQLIALVTGALLLVASAIFLVAHILSTIWFEFSLGQLINYLQILLFAHAIYSCRPNYLLNASRNTKIRIIVMSLMFIFLEASRLIYNYRGLVSADKDWIAIVDIIHAFTAIGISILLISVLVLSNRHLD